MKTISVIDEDQVNVLHCQRVTLSTCYTVSCSVALLYTVNLTLFSFHHCGYPCVRLQFSLLALCYITLHHRVTLQSSSPCHVTVFIGYVTVFDTVSRYSLHCQCVTLQSSSPCHVTVFICYVTSLYITLQCPSLCHITVFIYYNLHRGVTLQSSSLCHATVFITNYVTLQFSSLWVPLC